MILSLFHFLQGTAIGTGIRESSLVYPIIMTGHLAGMALFGGMILIVDMRLLGWGLTAHPVSDIVGGLKHWKHLGLTMTAGCGILLFWAKAEQYYPNPYLWCKFAMFALVAIHALVFRKSVYANVAEYDKARRIPQIAKIAAGSSMLLWALVVTFGRLIGYHE